MNINEIEKEIKANQESLKKFQKQQAGLEGELKQVNNQIKSFGLEEDTDVDSYLKELEAKTQGIKETLEDLLDQIQVLLDKIEGIDDEPN
jgi:chromosome segregation ATPase